VHYLAYLRSTGRVLARILLGVSTLFLLFLASQGEEQARATGGFSFGVENSWIRIQNIGKANATVDLDYYDETGKLAGKDTCPSASCPPMYPGSGWTFFQGENPTLASGFKGSSIISTDQPVVAVMAKDVRRGSKVSIAGDTLVSGLGSNRIYLPVTGKYDGPGADWSGRFVIQNLSDAVTACVTITYLSNYTDSEIAWDPYRPPTSGKPSNPLPGCPNGGMPLEPRGSIFRYPETMIVHDAFTGSVRIDLHTNGKGQTRDKQFITATADSWNLNLASFGSYRGFDESELGKEIVLPLMDRQVGPGNSFSTRFFVANKDPSKPATVTLRFDGYDLGGSEPGKLITRTNTFTIKGGRMCFQDRDDSVNCLAAGDSLPFNFVGTARLTSTEPIAVIVDRDTWLFETFTNYRGIRPQDAARRVLLPVLNKNYGPVHDWDNGWNSWFRVMVADGGKARVTITYYGLDLPGGSASYSVNVDREFTVFQYDESFLPNGFAGTAIIEADRPIVALANISTDSFYGDPDVLYNGVALD
jgi:hypothetical protein